MRTDATATLLGGLLLSLPTTGAWAQSSGAEAPDEPRVSIEGEQEPRFRVSVRVLERGNRRPLVGQEVTALVDGAVVAFEVTDEDGLATLEVGRPSITLLIPTGGREPVEAVVEAAEGEAEQRTYYITPPPSEYEVIIRARRIARDVSEQEVTREQVEGLAGATGDALTSVQALPSVGRVPAQQGGDVDSEGLILRGSAQGDSRVFLDGLEIPIIYHFGSLRSTFTTYFLEALDFVPGNFGPEYGRAIGGVVNVRVRDPADDGLHGQLDLNVYDASVAVEGPVGGGWSLGGAFRRSWLDSIIPLVVPESVAVGFDPAPRFYDYQLIASYRPDPSRRLRLMFYGSQDRFVINFPQLRSDPALRGGLDYRVMFHNLQGSYRERISGNLVQETSARVSYTPNDFQVGPEIYRNEDVVQVAVRSTWDFRVSRQLSLRAGLDLVVDHAIFDERFSASFEGEPRGPASTQQLTAISGETTLIWPATFAELTYDPVEQLTIRTSVRLDYYSSIDHLTVDPRVVVLYRPHESTVISAGLGLYQQPPTRRQSDPDAGNPDLDPARAIHVALGVEQTIGEILSVEVTGFYKPLDRLVTRNPASFLDSKVSPYVSEGSGRVVGVETLIKARYRDWFTGWIAYTYQRSLRDDPETGEQRPFDVDQPHMLTIVASSKIGAGFSAGLRFRLTSGSPTTPVERSIFDSASETYVPVYGAPNSARLSLYHQLDLRIDYTFPFDTWSLSAYLDVQNVYNRQNEVQTDYNYDYSESTPFGCCFTLPIVGVRGSW